MHALEIASTTAPFIVTRNALASTGRDSLTLTGFPSKLLVFGDYLMNI